MTPPVTIPLRDALAELVEQLHREAHSDQHDHEGDEYALGQGAGKLKAATYLQLLLLADVAP